MRLALVILLLATKTAIANPVPEQKSEDTALGLSLGITTLSWGALLAGSRSLDVLGIGAAGALLGPTTGHWYSGRIFTWGLGLRVLGVAAAAVGLVAAIEHDACHDGCDGTPAEVILLPIGLIVFAGGTISDIWTARGAARAYNEQQLGVSIVPLVQPGTAGVGLVGSF